MKRVYILGGEGNGLVIGASIDRSNPNCELFFLNDVNEIGTVIGKYKGIPVVGITDSILERLKDQDTCVITAYGGFTNPKKTLNRIHDLQIPDDKWLTAIDSTAVIPKDYCHIGKDTFIGPLTQVSPNVEIGDHCSLFGNSFIGHDSSIGEFCHIASNATVGSNVKIGKGVHVGLNCSIVEKKTIGDFAIIGAGSVITKDVPANAVVVGNPAKVLRYREEGEI